MSVSTGSFHIANGQIIGPDGQPFIAKGLNVRWDQLNAAVGDATNSPLLNYFPGLNMVRVYFESSFSASPSEVAAAIKTLTDKGIVVEIEDHTGISATPYTGSQLAAEQAWYTNVATTFKDNPYVWFGTFNEPGQGTNLAGIAAQELATYNTIRATGNTNPILMEEPSGGNPGLVGANAQGYDGAGPMTPSNYAKMTNIIWDLHYYGWGAKYSTDQAAVNAALQGSASDAIGIAGAQTITSADGIVPVIIGEFGNSTTGGAVDANADQVIQAVATSGKGFLAWAWNPDEQGDQAVTDSGQLTAYGKQIAAIIGTNPASPPTTTPTPTPIPSPSPDEITTTSGGTLTDGSGNKWTLTSAGVVNENGAPVTGGTGTAAVAIVNKVIYGQDAASKSWFTYSTATQTWTSSSAPVLTPTPPPTPTPTPNEVTTTSGGTLTDSAGNKWTLTSAGVVDENGAAVPGGSGTAAIALVNNVIYGQDATGKSWYVYSPTKQTWSSSVAPVLTPTPTPPPTTQLTTASGGTITDSAGNKWTLTSTGSVNENGTAVPGGSGTAAVVLVNKVIYAQDATSKSWYAYTDASKTWTSSAAPALPTSVTISAAQTSATVDGNNVSITATAGNHMVFIGGTGDIVKLSGGTDTITDTGSRNTYVIPAAGKGYDTFTSNVLVSNDTLDLRTALAATNWTGSASTLSKYLTVANTTQGTVLSIASTSGGSATGIATITGTSGTTLTSLLSHALT